MRGPFEQTPQVFPYSPALAPGGSKDIGIVAS